MARLEKLRNPPKQGSHLHKTDTKVKRKWVKSSKYKRIKKKLLKQDVSIVYNYSDFTLTPAMDKLLNRGLSFVVQPKALDFFDILSDFRYFERSCLWTEFWHEKETETNSDYKPPIFKTKK